MTAATAIITSNTKPTTKMSTIPKTKVNTSKTVIMLKNSKSMIFAPTTIITTAAAAAATTKVIYDRLINIIINIQDFYHQYCNDLFNRCNIKNLSNIRRHQCTIKRRSKRKMIGIKYKNPKPKLLTNTNNYKKNSTFSKITVKNSCYINVSNSHRDYKKNLKISYQLSDYLRHLYFYFQKNFNSLRLLIVIFILALITTTAQSIDTQGKLQIKSTGLRVMSPLTQPPPLPSASSKIASGTFKNLTDSIHLPCDHNQKYNFKSFVCCNLRHFRSQQLNSKLKSINLSSHTAHSSSSSSSSIKNVSIHYQRLKSQISHIDYHHHHHHRHHYDYDNQNNSNNLWDLLEKKYNIVTKVIKFEDTLNSNTNTIDNNNTNSIKREVHYKEENKEDLQKINKLNISKFLNLIQMYDNKYKQNTHINNNINSIGSNDTLLSNEFKNFKSHKLKNDVEEEEDVEEEIYKNNLTNDHFVVGVNVNHNRDNFDYEDVKDVIEENNSLNLLPTVTTASMKKMATTTILDSTIVNSTIYTHPHNQLQELQEPAQYIDHEKLMKLVMDGLGLKKPPDMKKVNISQKEYATKYREYLQRVHAQKSRHLKEELDVNDENLLKPLQFFSLISNSSLLIHQEYNSYNKIGLLRQKRYALQSNENQEDFNGEGDGRNKSGERKQTLEERVKNILFLRKKYQKPRSTKKQRDERKTNIRLMFALKPDILNLSSSDIEEANTRLVLIHSPILSIRNKKSNVKKPKKLCDTGTNEGLKGNHQINVLNLKLYFMPKIGKRILLDGQKVDIRVDLTKPDETHTQWLQFDVTKAIKITLNDKRIQNVAFELQCDNCKRVGVRILNDAYDTAADAQADDKSNEGYQLMPVLNIIGRFEQSQRSMRPHKYGNYHNDENFHDESTTQRHYHHQTHNKIRQNRRTNCYKSNQRCCRHSMEVTFKDIKGFEFIIQPKVFDAGYCHGRCPPRYNPAHHHAMLQSLIWKQNHHKAPRPCCAPSKLVELEVLHVDEKDSEKLKISTWSDMKVVECACS